MWCSYQDLYYPLYAGGFTAAFLDEAFGLLFYSLRHHGQLPFISPAFTAQLEVSFKKVLSPTQARVVNVCDDLT